MRRLVMIVGVVLGFGPAHASADTLAQVQAKGVVRCGASIRPGIAFPTRDGQWHGLAVDLCRAVAIASLGPKGQVAFHPYTLTSSFAEAGDGQDDVSFLTASEIIGAGLLGHVLPGPSVYIVTYQAMVQDRAPARHLSDLVGQPVCAEPGTGAERSVVAWFAQHHLPLDFSMFQEADEMLDAFHVGRCVAVVHETTSLAALGLNGTGDERAVRILPETISALPLMATTSAEDARWASIVGWTMQTILRAEQIGTAGPGGGPEPLPLDGPSLHLSADWQAQVVAGVGSYAAIYGRNLGAGSPLDLPRGLNAFWSDGGLFLPPYSE